jgi:hypothetical protein
VLVGPTTVGVADRIHRDSSHFEWSAGQGSKGKDFLSGANERPLGTPSSGDCTDLSPTRRKEGPEGARRQLDGDLPAGMRHDKGTGPGRPHEPAAVEGFHFHVGDERPVGNGS